MAVIANTFQTYTAKGIRESLSDIISRVEQEETPLYSNAKKESISNRLHEWQTQALASPDLNNAHVEGDDTTYGAITPTTTLNAYTQIMKKSFLIADTEEVVKKAGRASEINYQKILKGVELKRDAEAIMLSNQGTAVGDGATVPRKLPSLLAYIKTNTSIGATGANPVYTNSPTATRTDGTQRVFTEALLKDVLQQMYRNGAKTDMIMVGPVNKQRMSTFLGISQNRTETGKKAATIVAAADLYLSDFGLIAIVPNAFMRERDALLLDTNYVSIATLRPYKCEEMARTGDARKFMCLQELTLKVENERALGGVFDLTTV